MEKYTLGVLLNHELSKVVLILKNRPDWQKGLYNFPGGKIEEGEDHSASISREFLEECGALIEPDEWNIISYISDDLTYSVDVFTCRKSIEVFTKEDQPVGWFDISNLPENIVYHLTEILEDALTHHGYE